MTNRSLLTSSFRYTVRQKEAEQAGVRRGMVMREINQHEVKNVEDFRQAVQKAEQAKQVLLLVQSPQATMYLTFPIG